MFPDSFQFHLPTRIIAGPGIVASLGTELEKLGLQRILVVTDHYLRKIGVVDQVIQGLNGWNGQVAAVFDEVPPNSEIAIINKGTALAKETKADGILAVGGGSVIDSAKGINLLLTHGGAMLDYEGYGGVPGPLMPLVVIPTTAGTGSEVTIFTVIRDGANKAKLSFSSPFLLPTLAVLAPEFTVSLPPRLTAATGIDALTHAIEAYISCMHNPVSDVLALQAVRLIRGSLLTAVINGKDLAARYHLLVAATLAGAAFSNSMVGSVHALAHALGGLYEVPHGEANALFLPECLELHAQDVPERLAELAVALGQNTTGVSTREAALLAVQTVRNLIRECGLPQRLQDLGISAAGVPMLAEKALTDGSMLGCVRMPEREEIAALLARVY